MGKTLDADAYVNQLTEFSKDKEKRHKVRLSVINPK